jgi:uncharacterized delta-60 repeat protein
VVVGATGADRGEIVVQRYQPDGTLDASFGSGGTVQHVTASNITSGTATVAIMPAGQILVGGWTEFFGTNQPAMALLRLTDSGAPDTSFAPAGFARVELLGGYSQAWKVVALPDGRVLAAGQYSYINYAFDQEGFVARFGGLCGNGAIDPGEQCDDGNAIGFDCCSTGCQLDPVDSACDLVGRLCTFDHCDGAGTCIAGGPAPLCRAVTEPLHSRLKIRLRPDGSEVFQWMWRKGEYTDVDDFGFPFDITRYTMCFYGAGNLVGEVSLPVGAAWEYWPDDRSPTQFRYKAKTDITQVRLREGENGKAEIRIKAKGFGLGLPPLPLAMPVTVRLLNTFGNCWGATYDGGATSTDRSFSARGD